MKAHSPVVIVLAAILSFAGYGTLAVTYAAEQGSIQIRHRLTQDRQPGADGLGHLSVEVGNLGSATVEDLYISIEPTTGVTSAPPAISIGRLGPSQFRVFNFPVRRSVQVGDQAFSRLAWRIDYMDEQQTRRQAQIYSVSPNQGIEEGGRR